MVLSIIIGRKLILESFVDVFTVLHQYRSLGEGCASDVLRENCGYTGLQEFGVGLDLVCGNLGVDWLSR